jgi:recombination protein RecA
MGSRRPTEQREEEAEGQDRQPSLSPLSEPPQNVEVIRKPRKEKPVVEDDDGRGLIGRTDATGPLRDGPRTIDEERDERMAMTDERAAERARAERARRSTRASATIEKQFGRGAIMKLGSAERQAVDSIPTGSIALDLALGVGGIPRGRHHRDLRPGVVGQDDRLPARPRRGPGTRRVVAFIDVEHALDPAMPAPAASTSTSCSSASRTPASRRSRSPRPSSAPGGIDCVVVDSVAALVPAAEIEGEMGDSFVGIQARLMSQACAS